MNKKPEVILASFLAIQKTLETNPNMTTWQAIDIIMQTIAGPKVKITDEMRKKANEYLVKISRPQK